MISSIIQNRPQKFCDKTEATTGNQYVQRWAIFELQLSLELIKNGRISFTCKLQSFQLATFKSIFYPVLKTISQNKNENKIDRDQPL